MKNTTELKVGDVVIGVLLPPFRPLDRMCDPPHKKHVIVTYDKPNEHGVVTRFQLSSNWPGTRWYLTATMNPDHSYHGGIRASNGIATGSAKRAVEWERAVREGRVGVAPSAEEV